MSKRLKIRIRTFVLGINHGQLLQAKGMLDLMSEIFPDASVNLDLYHNHIFKELISQIRKLALVKSLILAINWFYYCRYSAHFTQRSMTIFGADTIWMYNHPIAPNDDYFFGADIKSGCAVAVCPSNAGSPYPLNDRIHSLLKKFRFVGVRDKHTAEFIKSSLGTNVNIVCDPAFFINRKTKHEDIVSHKRQQISVYANSCNNVKNQLAKANKSLMFDFSNLCYLGYFPSFYTNLSKQFLGIFGLIEEVERSKLLITDTFHGVVMALMTNTPFVLIRSDIVMSRLNGPILDCFHSSRICEPSQLIGALNKVDIYDDHDLQNGKLEEFIDSSRKHISSKLLSMKESKYRKC